MSAGSSVLALDGGRSSLPEAPAKAAAKPRSQPQSPSHQVRSERRKVVGATGFEPATPCAQGRCATRLRYAPTLEILNLTADFARRAGSRG